MRNNTEYMAYRAMAAGEIVDSRANMKAVLDAEGSLWPGFKAFGFSTAAHFSPWAILSPPARSL